MTRGSMKVGVVRFVSPFSLGVALGVVLAVAVPSHAVRAQQAADGLAIARQWCTGCHIVEPGGKGSDAARPFAEVANDPNFTKNGLRAWLADPHPPMPGLTLSNEEIDALMAYIASLRRDQ